MAREEALQSLRRHGKSFFWASFFLPPEKRLGAARLYALCRRFDDHADELPPQEARQLLGKIEDDLRKGRETRITQEVAELERDFEVPRAGVARLLRALIEDTRPRVLTSRAELLRYAYGVAGSVGLMMRPLLGAMDRRAIPYAVDLGVAMQLTNIARDVLEDAGRGRRYLPLANPAVSPQALLAGDVDARASAWREIQDLLELADGYYRSADRGMVFIPLRSRVAIATAARIYEAIGGRIQRLGAKKYWEGRARVGAWGKIRGTIGALPHGLTVTLPENHDPSLHQAFADLLQQDAGSEWMS